MLLCTGAILGQAANLDQVRNGTADQPTDPGFWQNGNAGNQTAHYREGQSIPYRVVMTSMPANGTTVSLILGYDIKHSNAHAIDYLTDFDRLQPHTYDPAHSQELIDPRIGTVYANRNVTIDKFTIPTPSSVGSPVPGEPATSFGKIATANAAKVQMSMWGGDITQIVYVTPLGSLTAANSEQRIRVTFTVQIPAGQTERTVVLAWGGHIASRADWGFVNGVPRSAGGISGSPYHMRLISWGRNLTGEQDGTLTNLGNQDRSLSAAAVLPPPDCAIVPGAFNPCPSGTATYSAPTGTGLTFLWTVSPSNIARISGASVVNGQTTSTASSITVNHIACGNYTVSLRVTQADGQSTECPLTRTVADNVNPTITPSAGASGGTTSLGCNPTAAAIDAALGSATAADNCGLAAVNGLTVSTGEVVSNGCSRSQTRTWTATDACGNQSTATRTVTWTEDITPPTITCPANQTLACGSTPTFGTPTVTDNCGGTVTPTGGTVTQVTNADGSITYSKTWTAVDACGNQNTCTQRITVLSCQNNIFPTGTTCENFTTQSVAPLRSLCVAVDASKKITNASNPGAWFFYAKVTKPAGVSTLSVRINQSITNGSITGSTRLFTSDEIKAWTSSCTQITRNVTTDFGNPAQPVINITGLSNLAQEVIISVKYNSNSIRDAIANTLPATYSFNLSQGATANTINTIVPNSDENLTINTCTSTLAAPLTMVQSRDASSKVLLQEVLKVTATPNPYRDRVQFNIESPVSGQGVLEVFNLLGQKVGVAYQGYIFAGKAQTIYYTVPAAQRKTLIYQLRVGNLRTTGKLIDRRE
ncbi:HYR-like domain-containing protein [Cnuella takakiae]|nr:hypothetical protein [Cnuella takakiae]